MWHEHDVIERMIRHNLRVLRYQRYEFFLGAYPNDTDTLAALARLQESGARVHICVCPHDGPTSKADCLNWIYQHMLLHEKQASVFFDAIITHDAEDLIHPDSLSVINRHLDEYDMVQIPVLPLPTGLSSGFTVSIAMSSPNRSTKTSGLACMAEDFCLPAEWAPDCRGKPSSGWRRSIPTVCLSRPA
jgi:hypothetical protein